MFELPGIVIFGIIACVLSLIHYFFCRVVYRKTVSRYLDSLLVVGFLLSAFELYGASPFIHMYTTSLSTMLKHYFWLFLSVHLFLIFIALFVFVLSLTPYYKLIDSKSDLVRTNFYAIALFVISIATVNLLTDYSLRDEAIGRAYDFQIRRGITDFQAKEKFFDLNSDLRLLESWIRSAIWTPWILLLILGSPNFRGIAKALSKNESSV